MARMSEKLPIALPNHNISNFNSFQAATREARQLAGLYFYMQLDSLIDLAYRVSYDFFNRPHLYTDLGEAQSLIYDDKPPLVQQLLPQLHIRTGHDELFPSKAQRDEIYRAHFGGGPYASLEQGDFPRLRDELLAAVAAYTEHAFGPGLNMLRERIRTLQCTFTSYLRGQQGESAHWSREKALVSLTEGVTYPIFRSRGISVIFGLANPSLMIWPYAVDYNADKLVEAISRQLTSVGTMPPLISEDLISSLQQTGLQVDKLVDAISRQLALLGVGNIVITRGLISSLQQTALRGAEALATIIDFPETGGDAELDLLINKCYSWKAAIHSVNVFSGLGGGAGSEQSIGVRLANLLIDLISSSLGRTSQ
jgi:hypothetical protein